MIFTKQLISESSKIVYDKDLKNIVNSINAH